MTSTQADTEEGKSTLFLRVGGLEGLNTLLLGFYSDVRQHGVLGPIFDSKIRDWPSHIRKIAQFWALQCGGPSSYAGGFGAAHISLGLKPEHFQLWLGLWEFNCKRRLPERESGELIGLAHVFAQRLFRLTSGGSALGISKSEP